MTRPSQFNQEVADEVCRRLEECGSLRRVCVSSDMPLERTVRRWYTENEQFASAYARAKEAGIDTLVDETLDIADDGSNDWVAGQHGPQLDSEHVQRSKIRIETRRWLAERMAPKKYGVRVASEISGPNGTPIQLDETARSARLAALLAAAKDRSNLV